MTINFFDAVSYNNQNKTTSQKVTESVDEYFYLGNKSRQVKIFNPDVYHSKKWAKQNFQDSSRSWMNVALKIVSYCTLILPLVGLTLKATLRSYLQIPSIPLEKEISQMENQLPFDILLRIGSFLDYKDQASFAQTSLFTKNAIYDMHQYCQEVMAPLKEKITKLPRGPLTLECSQQLLIDLLRSPAIGHPKFWVPIMNALMRPIINRNSVGTIIQSHASIANLLATSSEPVSSEQLQPFYEYLSLQLLFKSRPWIGYRALEQYLLHPDLDTEIISRAIEKYLMQRTEKDLKAVSTTYHLRGNRTLRAKEVDIDPREWFGFNASNYSLWLSPNHPDAETTIPEPVLKALWTRIQSLRSSSMDCCPLIMVGLSGRAEAELPLNFALPLAQLITTNEHIFLDHNSTIDQIQPQQAKYARSVGLLKRDEVNELAQAYPEAFSDSPESSLIS